ncbi:hypothetical protein [Flavobacterium sp. WC2509]|uniref:hypothetical protein n=1 Tax=Flavobacterium sp. WC2509 TaxID=3461406 RepID=UPI0040449532
MTLLGLCSHAQNVKGKIIDVFGHPIENAYVLNTTTESHAHTNELGVFNIEKTNVGNEAAPVEEIHFTPGTPFFLKGMITYVF